MTLAEQIDFLVPGLSSRRTPPPWPPDVFAICAFILHASGGYCVASCDWPPRDSWVADVTEMGEEWRKDFRKVPPNVRSLWVALLKAKPCKLADLQKNKSVCRLLLELLAIADEASMGVGVPFDPAYGDAFDSQADYLLVTSNKEGAANLCNEVRRSCARVLPKMHVPLSGFTLRSFSHYLAFIPNSELRPYWHTIGTAPTSDTTLDILLLPWPMNLSSTNFKTVQSKSAAVKQMDRSFGFFEFSHQNEADLVSKVLETVQRVSASSNRAQIDAVVMPELSLSEIEYDNLSTLLLRKGIYLIAGVGGVRTADGTSQNTVRFNIPLGIDSNGTASVPARQAKHHRWKLDKYQIERYGLNLPSSKSLWEHITIRNREISFVCLREWLAICLLVCEDLARPDPVGDVIRAVGPNLVIALLLDGPQLETRWSARYATALADDPGSSVLTLTCRGMTKLGNSSKPKTSPRMKARRVEPNGDGKIALWKDVRGKTHVIDIGNGDAALLHIEVQYRKGWTIDGRDDGKSSGYPLLKTVSVFKDGKPKGRSYNV